LSDLASREAKRGEEELAVSRGATGEGEKGKGEGKRGKRSPAADLIKRSRINDVY